MLFVTEVPKHYAQLLPQWCTSTVTDRFHFYFKNVHLQPNFCLPACHCLPAWSSEVPSPQKLTPVITSPLCWISYTDQVNWYVSEVKAAWHTPPRLFRVPGTVPTHAHDNASQAVYPTQRLACSKLVLFLHGAGLRKGVEKNCSCNRSITQTSINSSSV